MLSFYQLRKKPLISLLCLALLADMSLVCFGGTVNVPATASPYQAGMPVSGISPVLVPLSLNSGKALVFTATGGVNNGAGLYGGVGLTPDGDYYTPPLAWGYIKHDAAENANGMSNYRLPICSLVGVFLSEVAPNTTPAPGALNFDVVDPGCNVAGGIGYTALYPVLKQVFFVGDGLTGHGDGAPQLVYIPEGATRFYLAASDGAEWQNNWGQFTVGVTMIPEPCTLLLFALGGLFIRRR
jgi:hypothetical protein